MDQLKEAEALDAVKNLNERVVTLNKKLRARNVTLFFCIVAALHGWIIVLGEWETANTVKQSGMCICRNNDVWALYEGSYSPCKALNTKQEGTQQHGK